ncbi:hypothetical protein GDO81_025142, partial [Engystomops pustulosus]
PTDKNDEKVKPNGIRCKSCFAFNARACDCNVFVNCSVGETNCISRFISASGGGFQHGAAVRGCATKEMCEVAHVGVKLNNTRVKSNFSCTGDSDSFHNSLIFLVLIAAIFSRFTTTT